MWLFRLNHTDIYVLWRKNPIFYIICRYIVLDAGAYSCEAINSMGSCFAGSAGCGQPGQDAILVSFLLCLPFIKTMNQLFIFKKINSISWHAPFKTCLPGSERWRVGLPVWWFQQPGGEPGGVLQLLLLRPDRQLLHSWPLPVNPAATLRFLRARCTLCTSTYPIGLASPIPGKKTRADIGLTDPSPLPPEQCSGSVTFKKNLIS